jgi:polar amino acid transport system substrate-binding protein
MEVQPFFAPMERLQGMLQQGRLDGIATTNPYSSSRLIFPSPIWNITMWRSRWRSASWC